MKTTAFFVACYVLIGCLVTSCSQQQQKEEEIPRDAYEFSALSFHDPRFAPRPGQKFAWYTPVTIEVSYKSGDTFVNDNTQRMISNELLAKGYKIVEDHNLADYVIGAAFIDQNSQSASELTDFFRLFPSIDDPEADLNYATAFVGVIFAGDLPKVSTDPNSNLLIWRSSLRAFVMGDKLEPQAREQRLQNLMTRLMSSFP
jgi:hypothetical protein